ncbi:class I SAM-dependent methyltransferase [Saccharopolyspora halophila]|uniref:Class I SAM-dependent methyltransferase n=1 Tax=Saccharopolyspora halophila TaxID=405551 RepID=A0ABN3G9Y4_9PSEU
MSVLDRERARYWLDRWDAQQERYVADREERFAVIIDVVRETVGVQPSVLDLGCGPGSLGARLRETLPGARVVGLDADPLLMGLGRARYPELEFVDADLADPSWSSRVPGTVDAAVSTTALHWLGPSALEGLYARLASLIRPGGVFVNGDHLHSESPRLDALAGKIRASREIRAGVTGNEGWREWWGAVRADPELSPLFGQCSERAMPHGGDNGLSVAEHVDLLRDAGFAEAGPLWQSGDDTVLVALR